MSSVLEVKNLHKSYRSGNEWLHILAGLELELEEGHLLAITGESGSGKSTFLHLIGGMDRPDAGEIRFEGRDISQYSRHDLARYRNAKIGFVFQFHHLLPEFSALENVMFPLLIRGVSSQGAAQTASSYLEEVGLDKRIQHRPGELSGGEQQRVAVARALAGQPKLLLADEPTGNLDEHTAQAVFELILEIHRKRRLTSILVTHNLKLARRCDGEKRLTEGKLV